MLSLNSVMLGTDDPKPLVDFYTKIFGAPGWEDGCYTGWAAGSGYLMVGPHSDVKGRNESPGRIIVNFETPDVKAEFARIKATGATVVQEPYLPGGGDDFWLATIEDPDGNYFQLASPMPESM